MPKNSNFLMKIANIDREFIHIFWTTWRKSMKFSGKVCFKIILKVTKNQSFTLSLEDTFFKKPQSGSNWPPTPPPSSPAVWGLICCFRNIMKIIWNVVEHVYRFHWYNKTQKKQREILSMIMINSFNRLQQLKKFIKNS